MSPRSAAPLTSIQFPPICHDHYPTAPPKRKQELFGIVILPIEFDKYSLSRRCEDLPGDCSTPSALKITLYFLNFLLYLLQSFSLSSVPHLPSVKYYPRKNWLQAPSHPLAWLSAYPLQLPYPTDQNCPNLRIYISRASPFSRHRPNVSSEQVSSTLLDPRPASPVYF